MKSKVELTAETVRAVIERDRPKSLTGLAHGLGYKGSVSSSVTKKFRALVPEVDAMLRAAEGSSKGGEEGKTGAAKPKAKKAPKGKAKIAARTSKYPRDPRNVFRDGSSYATAFDVLASFPTGLPKDKLIRLLAEATGKDEKHAGYDAQVLLSAHGNESGLSRNDGPRHRSCRPGFWVERKNSHVRLVVD